MYSTILSLNTMIAGFVFAIALLYLIRHREMKERYILFWFCLAMGILLIMVSKRLLYFLVESVGAATPSAAILFFAVLALFLLNIHYSIKISRLERLTTQLIQDMGIMRTTAARPAGEAGSRP